MVHDVKVGRSQVRRVDRARVQEEPAHRRQVSVHMWLKEEQGEIEPKHPLAEQFPGFDVGAVDHVHVPNILVVMAMGGVVDSRTRGGSSDG